MASRPLRVLYLLHDSRRSGVPAVATAFIKRASEAGIEPTVLFAYDGIYAQELREAGIKVLTQGKRLPLFWRAGRFLMNRYLVTQGKRYDAVHIHSITLAWSVLIAKQLGLKVIFHLHELPRKIGPLLRHAMAAADCTVFCSETCAAHFAGINVQRSRTIVNALQFSDLPALQHDGKGKRIVMAASLNRNKGQDLLLAAFSKLRHTDAELWLYGTTGLSAHGYVRRLKQFARQRGIDSRVFFPGPTTEVFTVFSRSAVLAHTSWAESFGMALVEAQSAGIPVIAHDLEGMREVVGDGVTGFLVPPGDTAQLAARLDELLDSAELRNRMGAAGYHMTRDRFDINNRITAYRQLYSEVCEP